MLLSWLDNKPSVLGIITGAVVGLVAITPAAGYVTPLSAMVIGAVAAPISYYAIKFRQRRNLDESLDVWACHGIGGTWVPWPQACSHPKLSIPRARMVFSMGIQHSSLFNY